MISTLDDIADQLKLGELLLRVHAEFAAQEAESALDGSPKHKHPLKVVLVKRRRGCTAHVIRHVKLGERPRGQHGNEDVMGDVVLREIACWHLEDGRAVRPMLSMPDAYGVQLMQGRMW